MTEKIVQIKNRLLTARSRQKSYPDRRTKPLLKVSPWKGTVHFGKRRNLSPYYSGPFRILALVGLVAYTLELLEELKGIHSTFHVSNLKKCLAEGNVVLIPTRSCKPCKRVSCIEYIQDNYARNFVDTKSMRNLLFST
ncbi:hypothetical protein Tco_1149929 [Tanacetum coccineum]